ncbi:helix-turn-helix domain-containing protein [Salinigranum marinum]|uniref:helix-turn-helix domain-containing protein n=1 Tax=Salinigranum marinum TaxID=1515595 RepID=UPI002989BA69|nr:helix-turn-helix domain-containing protein [Salinigranum marinum]
MIRARFRMEIDDDVWVTAVSTSFPEATLRLLTGVPRGDRALELGEIRADDPERVAAAVRRHPDVSNHETVYVDDRRLIAHYEAAEQGLYEFLWESTLPPEFPVVVRNGTMEFGLTATREQFDAFGTALDDSGRQYELLTLVHTDDTDDTDRLLTERQREGVAAAQRHGYFEVPRECTLAELADELAVDTSTASETIRRATARIVGQYLLNRG